MSSKSPSCSNALLLTLLGGLSLGALAVALTTPKTGKEVRRTLKGMARRLRGNALPDAEEEGAVDMMFI